MRNLLILTQRYWLVLSVLLLAVVTYGSLTPRMPLPEVMSNDKLRHFLAYAAIALPIALARPRGWGWMLAGLLGWSIMIEFVQPLVGRSRDIRDFMANATGVGLGILLATGLRHFQRRPA